jgi:hypothetical protein
MSEILNERIITARKKHTCTASEIILNCCGSDDHLKARLSDEQYIRWELHVKNNYNIQKGDKYRYYTFADMGTTYTCKGALIATEICDLLDLWGD